MARADADVVQAERARAKSAEDECRLLRQTIGALRDELERLKIADQEALDRALAAAGDESRQLRQTAEALRDELERLRIAEQERLDRALLAAGDENRQLRAAVQALRDEMDRLRIAQDERDAQHARRLAEAQATIVSLRSELEAHLGTRAK
jgi:hypothetical protein